MSEMIVLHKYSLYFIKKSDIFSSFYVGILCDFKLDKNESLPLFPLMIKLFLYRYL